MHSQALLESRAVQPSQNLDFKDNKNRSAVGGDKLFGVCFFFLQRGIQHLVLKLPHDAEEIQPSNLLCLYPVSELSEVCPLLDSPATLCRKLCAETETGMVTSVRFCVLAKLLALQ